MSYRMTRGFLSKAVVALAVAAMGAGLSLSSASAATLLEKAKAGETVRIGFANGNPWAYPGDNNVPKGFVNAIAIGILNEMGITKIQPVVTDWGGLIPGLKANRFDVITGGMYILKSRCENINFSDPIGIFGDAFIVAKGNPKNLHNYQDVKKQKAILVTGAGYNIVEAAKKEGVPDSQVMQVPGPTEILAAVTSGRADAGGVTFFTANVLAKKSGGKVDVSDPAKQPDWTYNWVGIGFRKSDTGFLKAFNEALAKHIGSDAMMAAVKEYGYTKAQLPGDGSTAFACANR